jgi:hypothetical protein
MDCIVIRRSGIQHLAVYLLGAVALGPPDAVIPGALGSRG